LNCQFGKSNNVVGSNGFHRIRHEKKIITHGYSKWIIAGDYHTFHFPSEKVLLSAFVKNAFYIYGDDFYYSSDFTNILPTKHACYYRVNVEELLHPKDMLMPHKLNLDFVSVCN